MDDARWQACLPGVYFRSDVECSRNTTLTPHGYSRKARGNNTPIDCLRGDLLLRACMRARRDHRVKTGRERHARRGGTWRPEETRRKTVEFDLVCDDYRSQISKYIKINLKFMINFIQSSGCYVNYRSEIKLIINFKFIFIFRDLRNKFKIYFYISRFAIY